MARSGCKKEIIMLLERASKLIEKLVREAKLEIEKNHAGFDDIKHSNMEMADAAKLKLYNAMESTQKLVSDLRSKDRIVSVKKELEQIQKESKMAITDCPKDIQKRINDSLEESKKHLIKLMQHIENKEKFLQAAKTLSTAKNMDLTNNAKSTINQTATNQNRSFPSINKVSSQKIVDKLNSVSNELTSTANVVKGATEIPPPVTSEKTKEKPDSSSWLPSIIKQIYDQLNGPAKEKNPDTKDSNNAKSASSANVIQDLYKNLKPQTKEKLDIAKNLAEKAKNLIKSDSGVALQELNAADKDKINLAKELVNKAQVAAEEAKDGETMLAKAYEKLNNSPKDKLDEAAAAVQKAIEKANRAKAAAKDAIEKAERAKEVAKISVDTSKKEKK